MSVAIFVSIPIQIMASKGNESLMGALPVLDGSTVRVVIVKTAWNAGITDELENGARRVLDRAGVQAVQTLVVPGAVEIPFAIGMAHRSVHKADAYIALACVIRGDTPHFDYVCQSITQGITTLNTQMDAPVIYGVLTVNNEQQAHERLGGAHGHKGEEAAYTAIQMIAIGRQWAGTLL
jgi:6,7-dimethyl-8-ribityllumazine synthase